MDYSNNLEVVCKQDYCKKIKAKDEQDRTIKEVAMLKQYEDENWQAQFNYNYDYEDDEKTYW